MKKLILLLTLFPAVCLAGPPGAPPVTVDTVTDLFTGAGEYLKADGTTGTPSGAGDMEKSEYDTGDNSKVDVADAVTITDNESTAETNAILFTPGGDLDGGDLTPESDGGDFNYNPSTGTCSATEFSGGGASLTSVDAATGDSATAFFDAGTIEHEYGGLEADVNAYSGLLAISGGSTSEVDAIAEFTSQIADIGAYAGTLLGLANAAALIDIIEAGDVTPTGTWDFTGATAVSFGALSLGANADFGDYDVTSIDKLEGYDAAVYIDMGADGTIEVEADTGVDFGTAGVRFLDDGDGAITLTGLGNGSDEDLTINLDDTSNVISLSSSTGVTAIDINDMDFTSVDKLEGYDTAVYVDMGADGVIEVEADTGVYFGAAGVSFLDDGDGAITLLGLGDGSDEDLTINLDDTADTITFSSSTGVATWALSGVTALTLAAADDPFVALAASTASESDWWIGTNNDSEGDDDDPLEFRQSETAGTSVEFEIQPDADIIIGSGADADISITIDNDDTDGVIQRMADEKTWSVSNILAIPTQTYDATDAADTDITLGTEITSSIVYVTGDNDSDNDEVDLQDGNVSGQMVMFIAGTGIDSDDTITVDTTTDSTCTGCTTVTLDEPGDSFQCIWVGSTTWNCYQLNEVP